VQTLFGNAQSISGPPDGVVSYYRLDGFNPFEQFDSGDTPWIYLILVNSIREPVDSRNVMWSCEIVTS
jgi:hypothetical protein